LGLYVSNWDTASLYILHNTFLSNKQNGIKCFTAFYRTEGKIFIQKNTLSRNYNAIYFDGDYATIDISCNTLTENSNIFGAFYLTGRAVKDTITFTGNYIAHNTINDIFIIGFYSLGAMPIKISNNIIINNSSVGTKGSILDLSGCHSLADHFLVHHNTITNNTAPKTFVLGTGPLFCGHINYNNIQNNTSYEILNKNNQGSNANVDASKNYWYGIANLPLKIYDHTDDSTVTIVDYSDQIRDRITSYSCETPIILGQMKHSLSSLSINTYPNPIQDRLILEKPTQGLTGILKIFSCNGQEIITLHWDTQKAEIATNNWSPGAYIIQFIHNDGYSIQKIIKN
jgi:hypothetical protein